MGEISRMKTRTELSIPSCRNPSQGNCTHLKSGDVMEAGTDFYSGFCVSVVSEPVGRRNTAWALLCKWFAAFEGGKIGKWIFITFFICDIYAYFPFFFKRNCL